MDSSCLELRLGPLPGNPPSSAGHLGPVSHLPAALARARSEANLHASTLSLGPGTSFSARFLLFIRDNDIDFRYALGAAPRRAARPCRKFAVATLRTFALSERAKVNRTER